MFEKHIKREVMKAKEALKEELKSDNRETVKEICKEMVIELFTSNKNTEREYAGYFGPFEVETVVGILRKGVKKSVKEHIGFKCQNEAERLIRGEEFIDAIVDRIHKKQLAVK